MKRLLIMRHAKSDWTHSVPDHERPLNDRGTQDAPRMGRALQRMERAPDHVLSSTAVRARTSAELAAEAGSWSAAIELRPDLYGADVRGVLETLLEVDDAHETVMVVGHQPTWSALLLELTGAHAQMPTASVAGVDLDITSWSEAPGARGELSFLLQPRLLGGLD